MNDITDTQIASLISDVRTESTYDEIATESGGLTTVKIVEYPTVDDLMISGMKAVAAEIKFVDLTYSSLMDRNLVTQLVRCQLPVTRNS